MPQPVSPQHTVAPGTLRQDAAPGPGDVEGALAAARRAVDEHARASARWSRAREELALTESTLATARTALHDETADVERLESLSLARVWAGLRGNRTERLDAERAEQQAAEYVVATAEARVAAAQRELAAADSTLSALGDVDARWHDALAAKEEWLRASGSPTAAGLAEIAEQTGACRAQQVEIAEAQTAAEHAAGALGAAADHLRSAEGWSTYDTFFGGDMLASMVKHDKLDKAAELVRRADSALARLRVELGDVGEQGVGEIGVDGFSRNLDIWFDNIFTDLSVQRRITEARERVQGAAQAVDDVRRRLAEREQGVTADLARLGDRRVSLLAG